MLGEEEEEEEEGARGESEEGADEGVMVFVGERSGEGWLCGGGTGGVKGFIEEMMGLMDEMGVFTGSDPMSFTGRGVMELWRSGMMGFVDERKAGAGEVGDDAGRR